MVNTATLVIATEDIVRWFSITGHDPQIVGVPARN
jgi:hypothetical protein